MRIRYNILALAVFAATFSGPAGAGEFPHAEVLGNGIEVSVYRPEEILENMTHRDEAGNLVFEPEGGGEYIMIEDVEHPAIINKGDGSFHPVDERTVLEALGSIDIDGRDIDLDIDLYILPLPRLYAMGSSCSNGRIFMSPGTREVCREVCSYVVTHEAGHCFKDRYAPSADGEVWRRYLEIRRIIDDPLFMLDPLGRSYRPEEVFAEDFRYLFGGEPARYTGTIENPELPVPDKVSGLEEYYISLLAGPTVSAGAVPAIASVSNYPNPFNPVTTIKAVLKEDRLPEKVDVLVYAADGSLVRRLYSGTAGEPGFEIVWDGRDDGGAQSPSGVYFYMIRAGTDSRSGKMVLLR